MIIATAENFDAWRDRARTFLAAGTAPDKVLWQQSESGQQNLFDATPPLKRDAPVAQIPKGLLDFFERIACHRNEEKWALLYRLLWRVTHGENHLLDMATDPLMRRLHVMDGEVRRDAHKAKAFVRFRRVQDGPQERYIAWHRPDHRILPLVAGFFKRRFTCMRWSILTPDESVAWDGEKLQFGHGVPAGAVTEDSTEALWLRYYSATFNPARIKLKMMKREMPVRHWPTLPEAALIPQLLADAPARVTNMIVKNEGLALRLKTSYLENVLTVR